MHWLLNQQTLQTFTTKLDLNYITLKYAKSYFEGYGYPIMANSKEMFIRKLNQLVKEHTKLESILNSLVYCLA